MLVRLIRAYVSGARLENAARLGWARCYSTPIDDGPPKLTYPFFGNGETTSKQEQANKCIGRTGSDGYRYYAFSSDDGKYRLPSVTMVLSKTMAKSTQFALKNWKENLIKRHGPEGFEKISRDTVTRGTAFHKHLEQWLHLAKKDPSEGVPSAEKHEAVTLPPATELGKVKLSQLSTELRSEATLDIQRTRDILVAHTVIEHSLAAASDGDTIQLDHRLGFGRDELGGVNQEEMPAMMSQVDTLEQTAQGGQLLKLASHDEHAFPNHNALPRQEQSVEGGSCSKQTSQLHYSDNKVVLHHEVLAQEQSPWNRVQDVQFEDVKCSSAHQEEADSRSSNFTESVHRSYSSGSTLTPERILDAFPFTDITSIVQNHRYKSSIQEVLEQIDDVKVIEGVVHHDELGYAGTVDCVAFYRGVLCVIDWKTSTKQRPHIKDLYDYPIQAAAYAGALNNDPCHPFTVSHILIVVAYTDGSNAHTHLLGPPECLFYWEKWLDRLSTFQTRHANDLYN